MTSGIYIRTIQHKEKLSEAAKKNPTRYWLGKYLSKETRDKMSEAKKGSIPWNKGKSNPGVSIWMKKNFKYVHSFQTPEGRRKAMLKYWNGKGKTRRNPELRDHHNHNLRYRTWRDKVFKRDNYTCQVSGEQSRKGNPVYLEAHHIKSWSKFPHLRFKVDNGITLSKAIHLLIRKMGLKLCLS